MSPKNFAEQQNKYRAIYQALALNEPAPEFRTILKELAAQAAEEYKFWEELAEGPAIEVSGMSLRWYKFIRKILGLTFVARLIEREKHDAAEQYRKFAASIADGKLRNKIILLSNKESACACALVSQVKEEKVEFISSIVLGVNDGLIELTGALVGFSFALGRADVVALTGLITGLAASMSMAASAYMQARYEDGKDAKKAGIYTGVSYIIVVLFLVTPFLILPAIASAIPVMLTITVGIVTALSFYTSVLFERDFGKQFREMLFFSLGVALVAFVIGVVFRKISGVEI